VPAYHLAQLNVARMLAPKDDPILADFMAGIEQINALGSKQPGFVWLYETPLATGIETPSVFDEDVLIVNLTVWETVDDLYQFTYYTAHTDYYRRRSEWFSKLESPNYVLWWIPAGHIPTLEEAKDRLTYLTDHGATPFAFSFKQRFTAEEAAYLENADVIEKAQ
jgi:hypothetical protein